MRNLILTAAAGSLLAFSAAGSAEMASPGDLTIQGQRDSQMQTVVHVADLDLRKDSAKRALHQRVNTAIESLCDASHFSASDPHASLKCSNEAWASARPQMAALNVR